MDRQDTTDSRDRGAASTGDERDFIAIGENVPPLARDILVALEGILQSGDYPRAEAGAGRFEVAPNAQHSETRELATAPPGIASAAIRASFAEGASAEVRLPAAATLDRRALTWGGFGFLSGALAWHMVGLWSFVSAVAFNGDKRDAPLPMLVERALKSRNPKPSDIVTGSIASATAGPLEGCVAVKRHAPSGGVALAPCPTGGAPLRDAGRQHKSDRGVDLGARAANAGAWASTTETRTAEPALPAFVSGKLDPQ